MSVLDKFILAVPESEPPAPESADPVMPLPESSGQGFSEGELVSLRTIYKATVEQGHALHKCDSSEQAQRWADFLNCHLPEDRHAAVIREKELNCYTVSIHQPEPEDVIHGI